MTIREKLEQLVVAWETYAQKAYDHDASRFHDEINTLRRCARELHTILGSDATPVISEPPTNLPEKSVRNGTYGPKDAEDDWANQQAVLLAQRLSSIY